MYSREELQQGLETTTFGKKIFVFDSIDSTSACAKTLADAGSEEGTVVIADYQTAGRGRLGRSWVAEPGVNVLFSVILRPSLPKDKAGFLTFFAAVCVAQAVEATTGQPVECKWPNDLLLKGKKFCGILLENSFQEDRVGCSIVGIGLNVNQKNFDQDLKERATSLCVESGTDIDRKRLFQAIMRTMDSGYRSLRSGHFEQILREWNSRCKMFGQAVRISQPDQLISGIAVELSPEGGLVLETATGRATIYAGEVTLTT